MIGAVHASHFFLCRKAQFLASMRCTDASLAIFIFFRILSAFAFVCILLFSLSFFGGVVYMRTLRMSGRTFNYCNVLVPIWFGRCF